jgi:NAD(P)-dependent dehydrogenase (short-subunit alcohol dehydrogenase family)
MELTGRTVIVTGGASGIGEAYSRAFSAAGANVVIADLREDTGAALADELSGAAGKAVFQHTDVASESSTAAMAAAALEQFGSIDVLVNNAALYQHIGQKKPFDQITVEEWDQVMGVNTRGVWLCMKAVAASMRAQGSGKIVNISSGVVHAGVPWFCHYSASKGAVIALTRSAARELGPDGINVNAVAPGLVSNASSEELNGRAYLEAATSMRAIKREMVPQDLVGTVMFLSSPASDFITGQTYIVDGGVTLQ